MFTDILDEYLRLKNMDEREHPSAVDGYTNKQYWKDLEKAKDKLNNFFKKKITK